MIGAIFACYNWQVEAVPGWRPGMLPTILQRTGQVPTTRTYPAQNVSSAD